MSVPIALILATVAFIPALIHAGLPEGADVALHYWKTVDLAHTWSQADLWPRWSEIFYYGYGAPTFQFTAPAPYALAVLIGKLPLVDDVVRIKVVTWLSFYLAAWGAYTFAARRWQSPTALVVAASFLFAPAIVFIEPIGRASYPAIFGLGCMAAALSLLDSYGRSGRGGVLAVLALAGLLLSHNVTAVTGAALISGWLLWTLVFERRSVHPLLLFGLTCGLTGFFWIPVAFDRDNVSVEKLLADPLLDFRIHFETLPNILKPVPLFDMNLWGQFGKRGLGIISWLLAVAGVAVALYRRRVREEMYWLLVALVAIFLILPQSGFLWSNISLLETFQFPIRFLNVAALPLALLAAPFVEWIIQRYRYAWVGLLALLLIQGMRATPFRWTDDYPREATVGQYIQHELDSGILGTTASDEFMPAAVVTVPPPSGFLIDSLAEGGPAMRLNPFVYPEDFVFEVLDSGPTEFVFRTDSSRQQRIEVFLFRYPGWQATLDGEPLATESSGEFNFTILYVPPGEHVVALNYPLTRSQWAGLLLSGVALVGVFIVGLDARNSVSTTTVSLNRRQFGFFAGVVVFVVVGFALVNREGIVYYESSPGEAPLARHQLDVQLGESVDLLGYDWTRLSQRRLRLGLYWYFAPGTPTDVNAFVHVVAPDGTIVAQSDKLALSAVIENPGWHASMHLYDPYFLDLPESGDYRVRVGLWRCLEEQNTASCQNIERLAVGGEDFMYLPHQLRLE